MIRVKPPITYWGGKHFAVPQLMALVPPRVAVVVSPFIGGGSLEVNLAANGTNVVAGDVFRPIANFWRVLLDPELNARMRHAIREIEVITARDWRHMRRQCDLRPPVESAAWLYIINNHSYCGLMWTSSTYRPRPQRSLAETDKLADYAGLPIAIHHADFARLLKSPSPHSLVFADPPYAIHSRDKRRRYGAAAPPFDHDRLKTYLKDWKYWILTYGDAPEIREMYEGYPIVRPTHEFTTRFTAPGPKPSDELFILSKDLARIHGELAERTMLKRGGLA